MYFSIKKGFTLVEMIIVVMILTVGVVSAIVFINNGSNFTKISRQKVIAINFARQGIESVYQIRDTNWQKRLGKKDQCWLKIDPLEDEGNVGCEDDLWMGTGYYVIDQKGSDGKKYFSLSGVSSNGFDISYGMSGENVLYKLCYFTGNWQSCPGIDRSIGNSSEGIFLHQISGKGLYSKNTSTPGGDLLNCESGVSPGCADGQALEYRFCSKVGYMGGVKGEIEICSLMTNFLE